MTKRPNILFILSDQHRYDCTGYSNDYPVKTPNLDKLSKEGISFTNAYTPIPLCCPARQSLMNGRRPESFGALWNYDCALKIYALEPNEYSWTRDLKQIGYKTGYTGKWHVNPDHNPTEYGFDDYIETEYFSYRKEKYPDITYTGDWFGETDLVPLEDSHTHWMANQTIDLIEKYTNTNSPWFVRLNFSEPHLPCRPSKPFDTMYDPKEIPKWRSFGDEFANKPYIQKQQLVNWDIDDLTWEDWAPSVARYYGIISQMDDAIGTVLDKLDQMDIAKDTIVIYSTDHGDMGGGHRMIDKHYVLYDDIVKVPLIIKWPKVVNPGLINNDFVYNCLDLPPTILELLDLETKDFFHGESLVPLLKENTPKSWRKEAISTYNGQQFGLYTQRMIRNDEWKYIWNTTDVDEFYDMKNDPDELNNLIYSNNHADIIAKLREKLYYELKRCDDGLIKSPWLKNQLLNNRKL